MKCPLALIIAALLVFAPLGNVQSAPSVASFFGSYKGKSIVPSPATKVMSLRTSDLDLEVSPHKDDRFSVSWTTIHRENPHNSENIVRHPSTFLLEPAKHFNVFRTTDSNDPAKSGRLIWARVAESSLILYDMVRTHDGGFDLYSYRLTQGEKELAVRIMTLHDGVEPRVIEGTVVESR